MSVAEKSNVYLFFCELGKVLQRRKDYGEYRAVAVVSPWNFCGLNRAL